MTGKSYPGDPWYRISNSGEIPTPALLVYPDRIENNILKMISVARDRDMLRPHVKTHKTPEIVRMQLRHGIAKFKCATIAEAEMTAECGAVDILLAYQPAGPNIRRFFELIKKFPSAKISSIADCEDIIGQLSEFAVNHNIETSVWLDINNGMDRTGVKPGVQAAKLYKMIADEPMLNAKGLHVYDGHIHESDYGLRKKICDDSFIPVAGLIEELTGSGYGPVSVVAGGTPTFPVHAMRGGTETSPGTTLLWDYGYSTSFPDMEFLHSAVLLTRIISKPAPGLLCLDLGHKAVASEMPHPRIKIQDFENYEFVSHNEEHMVIRTPEAAKMNVGDLLYCIPYHVCPTVDRHEKLLVVRNGRVTEQWKVEARTREITV